MLELGLVLGALRALVATIAVSCLLLSASYQAGASNNLPVYVYELRLDAYVDHVVAVTEELVIAIGSLGGTSVVQFINISDPFRGPQVLFTYPLTGSVTSYAVDGHPARYIAVGTDLGEVVVFSIDRGRLYERLHYIQGANFVVNSVYLLRTPTTVKLLTLSVNRNLPSERYIYVFDINAKGVLRLGPVVGNLSYALEGITPHLVAPAKVVEAGGYYYDASRVFVTYAGLMATLRVNASYVYNYTVLGAGSAYVEVRVFSADRLLFTYDLNLDANGYGELLAPLGYLVELVMYDIYGNRYARVVNLTEARVHEVRHVSFLLSYPPSTRRALGGMPVLIKVFDFSQAPVEYRVVTDVAIPGYAGTPLHVIRPLNLRLVERGAAKDPYLILTKHYDYLNMTYMYDDYVLADILLYDYLGYGSGDVRFVEVDVNATYVIAALDDGRVRVYRCRDSLSGYHWFEQEYVALGRPLGLELVFVNGKPYYLLHSTGGLQVISLEPLQLPLLRVGRLLTYYAPEVRSADSLPDLSLVVLGGGSRLLIIRGLDAYIRTYGPTPIDLWSVRLPSLTVSVLGPAGVGLPNARVVLTYNNVSRDAVTDSAGNVFFGNVFPGEYSVSVYPQEPYLAPLNTTVYVPRVPQVALRLAVGYRTYELKLHLRDELGGGPQVPLDIYANGYAVASNYTLDSITATLPYGNYALLVRPHRGYAYFYEQINTTVTLDKNLTVNLTLVRKKYNVTIKLVDAVSEELVGEDVLVGIDDVVLRYVKGSLDAVLKAGKHLVRVSVPEGLSDRYLSTSALVDVVTDSTLTVKVPRRPYSANLTLVDSMTGSLAIGRFNIYVNGRELLVGANSTSSITLPYGSYVVTVRPQPPYDSVYVGSELAVDLVSDTSLVIRLERVRYTLSVRLYDPISKTPIAPLRLVINDTLHTIPAGTPSYTLSLPYGAYDVKLTPEVGYEGVYHDVEASVSLARDTVVDLMLTRKLYNLSIVVYDITSGPILGLLDVEVNGVTIGRGISHTFTISLPYGTYNVRVKPQPPYAVVYSDSEVSVSLSNHTVVDVIMSRKYYPITFMISDDRGSPVTGADILIVDTVTGSIVGRGISGGDGRFSTSLYYGSFRYVIRYGGFYDYTGSLELTTPTVERVTLTPLPLTVLMRYLPIIVVSSLVAVSVIALMKLRSKIAERLLRSEELF